MIHVKNLNKNYIIYKRKSFLSHREMTVIHAVKNLSFDINDGEKVGLIGLNGAGKSTTIKILTGIITPSSGELAVNGFFPQKRNITYLRQIGVAMGQRSSLFFDIPVRKSLEYYKEVYRISDNDYRYRIDKFDSVLDIRQFLDTPVRKLSFGQRMKIEVVCAMLHMPNVLFLDEPTIGLDVVTKNKIFKFLNMMNREHNCTMLLTTHELENMEKFCNRILVLKQGELVYDGIAGDFCGMNRYRKLCVRSDIYHQLDFQLVSAEKTERGIEIIIDTDAVDYNTILKSLMSSDFTVSRLSLEDMIKFMEGESYETNHENGGYSSSKNSGVSI